MSGSDRDARIEELSPAKRRLLERMLAGGRPEPAALSPVEQLLATIWGDVLRVGPVGPDDDWYALGGDSIRSLQVAVRAARAGLRVTSQQVLEAATVRRLGQVLATASRVPAAAVPVVGSVPLTPIQRWFFDRGLPRPDRWALSVPVELRGPVDEERLRAAFELVVGNHEALGRSVTAPDGRWTQRAGSGPAPAAFRTVVVPSPGRWDTGLPAAERLVLDELRLAGGPLAAAVLVRADDGDVLVLAVHHLVCDGVSLRVLLDELGVAYAAAARGLPAFLPAEDVSFAEWSRRLAGYAADPRITGQLPYWLAVPRAGAAMVPVDRSAGDGSAGAGAAEEVLVPAGAVAALAARRGADVLRVLLAGLLLAWQRVTGRDLVQVDVEGHGRDPLGQDLDLSRTVGWFTSVHPVVLDAGGARGPGAVLSAVAAVLDRVPDAGFGYGVLRYLRPEGAQLAGLPASGVSFNYLGRFDGGDPDGPLGAPVRPPRLLQDPGVPRPWPLEVVATALERGLVLEWGYDRDVHDRATVRALAGAHAAAVAELAGGPDRRDLAAIRRRLGRA